MLCELSGSALSGPAFNGFPPHSSAVGMAGQLARADELERTGVLSWMEPGIRAVNVFAQ